ncbi:MAG: hypothetical protein HY275_11635 [Gemmatimonadetes bacterium]|nr:hypothetical protein [Gemmatimonadota bacterium]
MRLRSLVLSAAGLLVIGCAGDTAKPGIAVAYAIVQVLDGTGAVTAQYNVVADGPVGSPVSVAINTPTRLRFLWMSADSTPEPAAASPSLSLVVQMPPGFGLTWTPSATTRYEGTLTGTVLQPSPVFVPMHLQDASKGVAVFSMLTPITVH